MPARRSSANWRIVRSGTSRTSCIADWKKMCTRLACLDTISVTAKVYPLRKRKTAITA